ncbi:MAG: M20/M25/M40 family metallo-hydrolase [Myxococcota bacterium]|nr:M20/M25/M40 family metallo-hydrolase [Myxococcota bacterium]
MKTRRSFAACLTLISLSALGCATAGPSVPAPPAIADALNLKPTSADARAVQELMVALIQADTSNPPGNEGLAVAALSAFFEANGITSRTVTAPGLEDRPILIAELRAPRRFKKPLVLLGHTDVVPADAKAWKNGLGPFLGREQDGFIWGRGALDMKGMLAAQAMSLVLIKRHFENSKTHKLERDLFFVATPDEEHSGRGAQYVAEQMEELFGDRAEYVINEGGIGLKDLISNGQNVWAVSVAERGNVWIEVSVKGQKGHGSQPWSGFAIQKLIDGITRLRRAPFPVVLTPATRELLRRAAPAAGFPNGFMMERAWLVEGALTSKRSTNASVRNTCIETGLRAGTERPNVIPGSASATLDCRMLPGQASQELIDEVKGRLGLDEVELRVIAERPGTQSDWTSPLFGAFERHLPADGREIVAPVVSPGSTDSAWFRLKGVPYVYGVAPFMISQSDLESIHGVDERLARSELVLGVERLTKILADVAGVLRPQFKE